MAEGVTSDPGQQVMMCQICYVMVKTVHCCHCLSITADEHLAYPSPPVDRALLVLEVFGEKPHKWKVKSLT